MDSCSAQKTALLECNIFSQTFFCKKMDLGVIAFVAWLPVFFFSIWKLCCAQRSKQSKQTEQSEQREEAIKNLQPAYIKNIRHNLFGYYTVERTPTSYKLTFCKPVGEDKSWLSAIGKVKEIPLSEKMGEGDFRFVGPKNIL